MQRCFQEVVTRKRNAPRRVRCVHTILGEKHNDDDSSNKSNAFRLMTASLLQSSLNRAARTISDMPNQNNKSIMAYDISVDNLTKRAINRSSAIVQSKNPMVSENIENEYIDTKHGNGEGIKIEEKLHIDKRQYLSNPSVTPTALAHSLWSQVIHPYTDTIIDATCGNGKDTLTLAKLLFPVLKENNGTTQSDDEIKPQIIGIDIQKQACENTISLLTQNLPSHIVQNNINILHASHAPLPRPNSSKSVGLICYNLGYLPGSGSSNKHVSTKMITTVYSLADAALLLRVGGLLSVMTYPGSSYLEYCSVKYFVEGLAMFSSRDNWRGFVDSIPDNDLLLEKANKKKEDNDKVTEITGEIRESVRVALERVINEGDTRQTWRAFDHKPLGRPMSPILFTAMRIK